MILLCHHCPSAKHNRSCNGPIMITSERGIYTVYEFGFYYWPRLSTEAAWGFQQVTACSENTSSHPRYLCTLFTTSKNFSPDLQRSEIYSSCRSWKYRSHVRGFNEISNNWISQYTELLTEQRLGANLCQPWNNAASTPLYIHLFHNNSWTREQNHMLSTADKPTRLLLFIIFLETGSSFENLL